MTPDTLARLKEFAAIQQNKDVMLLAKQGLNYRQIASALSIRPGTVTGIIASANKILGNDGGISAHALGESLRGLSAKR